ncbi:PorT family protein [Flavobacterium sp. xlx-214]|uniref:porin family protein n=1 Tax=unclassified Flavobacterium TaxID=196869 RepID=UPI0013D1D8B0|nr:MULTISPECIES: porin family protein [unclassified Flavobacterium]MBA5791178.1 PorT family protein [Flavobacterium sp. xlx-221]QMI83652.1 PorT family protein [Flavobacterium sp. xlx-214]
MKKILLSIAFLGLLTTNSFAQRSHKNPIETGIKAGVNMSTFQGGNTQDFKPGLQIGGTVEIPVSYYKKFAVQAELLYSVQGYKGKEYDQIDLETSKVTETLKLEDVTMHYLYVPITLKYYVSDNFSIEVGGQVGYMLDAKGQFDANKYNTAREYLYLTDPRYHESFSQLDKALFEAGYRSKDPKDYYEKLDYGINGGFSYYMKSGVYLNFRYYLGLQDIYKKDNEYRKIIIPDASPELAKEISYMNDNLKFAPLTNSSVQLSIGYKF